MATFLVLAHIFDASNIGCFLHLHTWSMLRHMMFFVGWDGLGWGGDGNVPRSCTHVRDNIPPASAFVDQTWLQS